MRVAKVLLTLVVLLAALGGAAFGAGVLDRDLLEQVGLTHDQDDTSQESAADDSLTEDDSDPGPEPTPIEQTKKPKPKPVLKPGDKGKQVRELQHRLFQLAWWPEKTTGSYNADTKDAVAGFQGKRGFKQTGVVNQKTWKRLVKMSKAPTHDQLFNILKPGPTLVGPGSGENEIRDVQARLKQIAWFFGKVTGTYGGETTEAVKGFQKKRAIPVTGDVDQRTKDRLYAMTSTPSHAQLFNIVPKPGELDPRCKQGSVLCIDKTTSKLKYVVNGSVQTTVDVRFGSAELPTREGAFSVFKKSRDHVSSLYHTSMPYAMFFSGGQAVHYSPDFAANGYNGASHGCVNVRDKGAVASLFDRVNIGTPVIVYRSGG